MVSQYTSRFSTSQALVRLNRINTVKITEFVSCARVLDCVNDEINIVMLAVTLFEMKINLEANGPDDYLCLWAMVTKV